MIISPAPGKFLVNGTEIPFKIVPRNSRHTVRISFSDDGFLLIEAAQGKVGEWEMDFIRSKERWIQHQWKRLGSDLILRRKFHSEMHQKVPLLGTDTPVNWIRAGKTRFRYEKFKLLEVHAPEPYIQTHRRQLLAAAGKSLAKGYLERRLNHWAEITQLSYNRLSVKDHVSKWGSCSQNRNINLNWNLVWLEEKLVDYVIVHELMHLHEMNHGPRFWNWVERYIPECRKADKQVDEKQWVIGILR